MKEQEKKTDHSNRLKFRAWDKRQGIMFHFFRLCKPKYSGTLSWECKESDHDDWENSKWEDLEIMQSTGLKDKNGKDIYEGDIVKFIDTEYTSNESGSSYDDLPMVESVVWNEDYAGWDVSSRNYIDREDFIDQTQDDVEVIGNIYEHPELLKQV